MLTADGHLLKASESENPDLFWGLRGGGGNFGVVTSFEYRLHELADVLGGLLIFPFGDAQKLLTFYDEFSASAPDELGMVAALGTLPDGTKVVVHPICYSGNPSDGEKLLSPLKNLAPLIADQTAAMPYTAVQSIVENFNPRGLRNYWKALYVDRLDPEAIGLLTQLYASVPAPHSHIVIYTLGGAVSRIPTDATAVAYRDKRHALIAIGMWEDPAADQINIQWVRKVYEAMQPFAAGGFYPNYDADAAPDRLVGACGEEKYARLAAIKQKYDPANVFCLNQNIVPALKK